MIPQEREGFKGELLMGINPTHIPELLSLCITFYLLIECMRIQSFNSCKRMGVSGHIPYLLEIMA
jgi:hypothetical protein